MQRVTLVATLVVALVIVAGASGVNYSWSDGSTEPETTASGSDLSAGDQSTAPKAGTASASTGSAQVSQPLVIFDSFDGPAGAAPNPGNWSTAEGTGWDRGIENYTAGNAVLDGQGRLAITAVKTDDGYVSGRVQTKDKASFGYGTLIARIKMPAGKGLWPAFFLLGADEDSNPWPEAGEIDVVELVSDPHTWYSSIHGPIPGVSDYLQAQITGEGPDLSADFHDYWVIHSKNSITMGINDTVWGTFTPESLPSSAEWVYNKAFYVVLKLAVGGDWAGLPDSSTEFPATMLVEYVHWEPA